jgi:hypothetical protein
VIRAEMLYVRDKGTSVEICIGACKKRAWAREAEESPLLEAVARERLVKRQAGKCLAGAVVICELWSLAVTLKLLVVPSRVCKMSINPLTNPNTVYSHTHCVAASL